jgi:hypothetical protein
MISSRIAQKEKACPRPRPSSAEWDIFGLEGEECDQEGWQGGCWLVDWENGSCTCGLFGFNVPF